MRSTILGGMCLCTLIGILILGLWPFTAHPKNRVTWIENSKGIRFRNNGQIVSSGMFGRSSSKPEGACSLEMWLEPDDANNTILAFYRAENPFQFRIQQSQESLWLSRADKDHGRVRTFYMGVYHVLRRGKKLLVTITSGGNATRIYIDGEFAKLSPLFGLTAKDFTGELIVGNTPLKNSSWSGQLWGLAIYEHELNPPEVVEHYHLWASGSHPGISDTQKPIALYSFDEGSGQTIHNRVNSGPNLYIPKYYEVRQHIILEPFWKEYHSDWGYYKDLAINIFGFMPLGLVFSAYFSRVAQIRRAVLASIVLGLTVSLTIEILQAFIPTRNSGMTDIITNTLGTGMGASLYGRKVVFSAFEKLGL